MIYNRIQFIHPIVFSKKGWTSSKEAKSDEYEIYEVPSGSGLCVVKPGYGNVYVPWSNIASVEFTIEPVVLETKPEPSPEPFPVAPSAEPPPSPVLPEPVPSATKKKGKR